MNKLTTLGLIALFLAPAYAGDMEEARASSGDEYQATVSDHGTVEKEMDQEGKAAAEEFTSAKASQDAPAQSDRVLIIASTREHVAILADRLEQREPSIAGAPRLVKMLPADAKPAEIIQALSLAESGAVQAVVLDGDFAKEATVSDKMDELRSRGIFARAIGTTIPKD